MEKIDLSILIPARNEMFLARTVEDILEHIEGNTEVLVGLDGEFADPPVAQHPRVNVIYYPESIGQRAITNQLAKIAKGKYLMKVDAHCSFDQGFDVKLIKDMHDDWTMIPEMRNLHAFDWVCKKCGNRWFQSPTPTHCKSDYDGKHDNENCDSTEFYRDVIWKPNPKRPKNHHYRFDNTLHFQYFREAEKRAVNKYGVIVGFKLSFDVFTVPIGIIEFLTNFANSHFFTCSRNDDWLRQNMTMNTMGFSHVNNGRGIGSNKILVIGNKSQMHGVTTFPILTQMINNWDVFSPSLWDITNNPGVKDSMCECFMPFEMISTISAFVDSTTPVPAEGSLINSNFTDELCKVLGGRFVYSEKSRCFHNGSVTLEPVRNNMIVDTMSAQGSAFLLTKKKYFELDICDEKHGSWGQQGVEVACKTWLSGGRLVTNKKTWYAHMFRTQGGDFGFPYPNTTADQARAYSRDLWLNNKWDKAIHTLDWLIEKFAPVPDWDFSVGILYYSDCEIDPDLQKAVQEQIKEGSGNHRIVSVTLKPCAFGDNIHLKLQRGYLTMAKQILYGLENLETDIVFFTEHDVLYHPSHFDYVPSSKEIFYYNTNVWRLRVEDGLAVRVNDCRQLSGLVCYRELAVKHFKKRVEMLENKLKEFTDDPMKEEKFKKYVRAMGFEPGTHNRAEKVDDYKSDRFESKVANIDIRHGENLTPSRWSKEQFRNKKYTEGWQETYEIPGWGKTKDLIRFK